MKLQSLALATFIFLLNGCGADYWPGISKEDHIQRLVVPEDEGTPEQHEKINATKKEIIRYARKLGVQLDLDRLPIVVRTSNAQNAGLNGTCNYEGDGTAKFIEIYSDVFRYEARAEGSAVASPLFVVILHEIGHCYYMRQHESAILEEPSSELVMSGNYFSRVAASVMVLAPSYYFPRAMKPYYVAEILGLQRAHTVHDLRKYVRFGLYRY